MWSILTTKTSDGDVFHVVPDDDVRAHSLSMDCSCRPKVDEEELNVVVHSSFDERELFEEGRRRVS